MDDPALFMPHLEFTQNLGLTPVAPLIGSQAEHAFGLSGFRLTNFISDAVVFAHNS